MASRPSPAKMFLWQLKAVRELALLPRLIRDRKRLDAIEDLDEVRSILCVGKSRGYGRVAANQHLDEMTRLCELIAARSPAVVVEIGSAKGGTLYLWSRLIQANGLLVSIDLPGGPGSVRWPTRRQYRNFGRDRGVKVCMISMSSRDAATLERLQEILGSRKIDFLFIDGDHRYEGVKYDFTHYLPFVSEKGLVALHDVNLPVGSECEVGKFWKELEASEHATQAIIGNPPRNMGIGLVSVDGAF